MQLSYWEYKEWFSDIDYCVIGSGIVGLNCAIQLKNDYPDKQILIIERSFLPNGASTKNAGFACFGSLSEIISDLNTLTENELIDLITKRVNGLKALRRLLGDDVIDYHEWGGYELFFDHQNHLYDLCHEKINEVNHLLYPIFGRKTFSWIENSSGFQSIKSKICFTPFEGQINTGKLMKALLNKAQILGIKIVNGLEVNRFQSNGTEVEISTDKFAFKVKSICIANNGFATKFFSNKVKPARAQVLITKPIKNLQIKGTYHLDQGYYYFRNIDNRILLGGGRNLDFQTEESLEMEFNPLIQDKLETLLRKVILPDRQLEIDQRWTGIMGVGDKLPIIESVDKNIHIGVRLGGMGVAIGCLIGQELAHLASS